MRPNAIYSKSGKGVQEASGKTSLLKREHRVVLAAIDGRATLADVAQKSGNAYDAEFQRLIIQLDKDGFIREVSSGAAAGPAAAAAKPAGKLDTAIDLDFSSLASSQKANTAPQPTRPPPPPAARPRKKRGASRKSCAGASRKSAGPARRSSARRARKPSASARKPRSRRGARRRRCSSRSRKRARRAKRPSAGRGKK